MAMNEAAQRRLHRRASVFQVGNLSGQQADAGAPKS